MFDAFDIMNAITSDYRRLYALLGLIALTAIMTCPIFYRARVGWWRAVIPVLKEHGECRAIRSNNAFRLFIAAFIFTGLSIPLALYSGPHWYVTLLMVAGIALMFVYHVVTAIGLARAFRYGAVMSAGLILFPPLFRLIVGVGPHKYSQNRRKEVYANAQQNT